MKYLFTLFTVLLISRLAIADVCFTTFEQDTAKADVIFIGKLIQINPEAIWIRGAPTDIYTFQIAKSFKGISEYRDVISIVSPVEGCCSPRFTKDSTFIVFAYSFGENSSAYWTNDCSMTSLLSEVTGIRNRFDEAVIPKDNSELKHFNDLIASESIKEDSVERSFQKLNSTLEQQRRRGRYLYVIIAVISGIALFLAFKVIRAK